LRLGIAHITSPARTEQDIQLLCFPAVADRCPYLVKNLASKRHRCNQLGTI
jgi:hypothetical protein